ncbi:serine hydrolase [Candidatus Saccharibacteria bacterium]|nr:serine hydrolase [Candidatus Saccharibacteria bacterium]
MDQNSQYQPQTPAPTPAPSAAPLQQPPYSGESTYPQASAVPSPQPYQQPQNQWATPQQPAYPQAPQVPQPHDMSAYPGASSSTPPPRPRVYGKAPAAVRFAEWLKGHWYVPIGALLALVLIGNILWQVLYPMNSLAPGLAVDGIKVGGMDRDEAVAKLNEAYGKLKVNLFFGDATVPYKTPTASELGIQVDNTTRLANASYPFALRFVPTSYWWASSLSGVGEPVYNYDKATLDTYALKNLGQDCVIPPKNASLKLDDDRFSVISAEAGGKCNLTEFKEAVGKTTYASGFKVKTNIKSVAAPLTNEIAQQLGDELNNNLKNDMPLQAAGETTQVRAATVKGWLSFKAYTPEDKNDGTPTPPPRLLYVIEPDRVKRYLETSGIAAKVEKKPGVTKVSTTDFTETARTEGTPGVLVDITKTIASVDPYVNARASRAEVIVGPVPATVQYARKYTPSDAGYRALIQQFAQDNPGKIGIAMRELSGKRPLLSGAVNENERLPAAGIEGIYLAYVAQKGIEDGAIQPTDQVYGNLSYLECMEAAISDQNQDCIAGLLGKIGNATVQARLAEIGLTGTDFRGAVTVTTANDMALFTEKLNSGEGLPIKQREKLMSPLSDISLRDGIKGAASNSRVLGGASGANYNEAAVVITTGQYVVSIMTQDSDGAKTTSKLIKAIDVLRKQKQDLRS